MPQLYTELEQKSNSVQTWSNSKGDVISIQQSQNGEVKHKQIKYHQIVDPIKLEEKYKN
tara:strand:- start:257 stop:433 length:177 start_codon:yes stop_codon:yes gene_type:complete